MAFAPALCYLNSPSRRVHSEACSAASTEINRVDGLVKERVFRGSHYQLRLGFAEGMELILEWPSTHPLPRVGQMLSLSLDPQGLTVLRE